MTSAPTGDGWLHEVKWDGYRIVTTIVRGEVRYWSRIGIEWTQKMAALGAAVAKLKLDDAQLDGEMIVPLNPDRTGLQRPSGMLWASRSTAPALDAVRSVTPQGRGLQPATDRSSASLMRR